MFMCLNSAGDEANGVLDAFFLGKAIAETVNERLGAALGDALSEITKANAEAQASLRSAHVMQAVAGFDLGSLSRRAYFIAGCPGRHCTWC